MARKLGMTLGIWWRFSRYEVRGRLVCPAPDAELKTYSPWEEFEAGSSKADKRRLHPPYERLMALFPSEEKDGTPSERKLPREIDEEGLLNWCKDYGLLGVLPQQTLSITLPPCGNPPEAQVTYVRTNSGWRALVRALGNPVKPVALCEIKGEPEQLEIGRAIGRFFPSVPIESKGSYDYPVPLSKPFWRKYAESIWDFDNFAHALKQAFQSAAKLRRRGPAGRQEALQGLRPLHRFVGTAQPVLGPSRPKSVEHPLQLRWASPSLEGILAFRALMDISNARRLVNCHACGDLFVAASGQALYCSTKCSYRAAKQRQRAR